MADPSPLTSWNIRTHLADARIKQNLTPKRLAGILGISEQTVRNWEKSATIPTYAEMIGIGKELGMGEEISQFLANIARDKLSLNLENVPRYNALGLAKAELHYGSIWKYESNLVPGILQIREYDKQVLQPTEGMTDEETEFGADFKQERQEEIKLRSDPYRMSIIMGATCFYDLKVMDAAARREQIEAIREWNSLPNWEIRVMNGPSNLGIPFDVYVPGKSKTAGPPFAYVEIHDRSWCIEELERVEGYHERIKRNWTRSTYLEEFLDAERNRLA